MNTVATKFENISATTAAFIWRGGRGTFIVKATGFGTVKLQYLLPDNTTWDDVDQGSDTFVTLTADGAGNFDMPPCQMRVNVATATAVYATVVSRQ